MYEINAFFDENPNQHNIKKKGVTLEQKQRFLENVKMFEEHEAGIDITDLSKKYELDEDLVKRIISSVEEAKMQLK